MLILVIGTRDLYYRVMVYSKLEQQLCCTVHEVAQTFAIVEYVREMIAKKSNKCGEYGSFRNLTVLFSLMHMTKRIVLMPLVV